jgi:hypothetical protein
VYQRQGADYKKCAHGALPVIASVQTVSMGDPHRTQ